MRFSLLLLSLGLLAGCSDTLPATQHTDTTWASDAAAYRGQTGQRVTYTCPPNPKGDIGTVWGAEVYTDDSSVCAAAVHAGKISFERGGRVTIQIRDGQASYRGTDWNGVTSQPYGEWGGSFVFA